MNQFQNNSQKGSLALVLVGVFLIAGVVALGVVFFKNQSRSKTGENAQLPADQTEMVGRTVEEAEKREPVADGVLSFDPQEQSIGVGEKFALRAMFDAKGKKMSAAQLNVIFDPKRVKLESIAPSDVFSLVLSEAKIDNSKGTASIALAVPLGKSAQDAVSPVAVFAFQALEAGEKTEISFSDKSAAAVEEKTGNAVVSRTSAVVSVR